MRLLLPCLLLIAGCSRDLVSVVDLRSGVVEGQPGSAGEAWRPFVVGADPGSGTYATLNRCAEGHEFRRWQSSRMIERRVIPTPGVRYDFASLARLCPDGITLASLTNAGAVALWPLDGAPPIALWEEAAPTTPPVIAADGSQRHDYVMIEGLAWAGPATLLVARSSSRTNAAPWNPAAQSGSADPPITFASTRGALVQTSYERSEELIAVSLADRTRRVLASGGEIGEFAVSPDGAMVAVAWAAHRGISSQLRVLAIASGRVLATLGEENGSIRGAAWSRDGGTLFFGDRHALHAFVPADGSTRPVWSRAGNGPWNVAAAGDGPVAILASGGPAKSYLLLRADGSGIRSTTIEANGKTLWLGGDRLVIETGW
jgi:hypothetical protein